MKESEIVDIMFKDVQPILKDWKFIKSRSTFFKKTKWGEFKVYLMSSRVGYQWYLDCVIGVRINEVENIMDRFRPNKLDPRNSTYSNSVFRINESRIKMYSGGYLCESEIEIYATSKFFASFLEEHLIDIEIDWSNLFWLEKLYNSPESELVNRPAARGTTAMFALIFSKLTNQNNFEELVLRYDRFLNEYLNKDVMVEYVYPERFNALVEFLRQYKNGFNS